MVIGLFCTLTVKLPGTLIILLGAVLYGLFTDFVTFTPWIIALLVIISISAEAGGLAYRKYLTKKYAISSAFSVNSTVSHIAGILVSAALLGPVIGFGVWELIAGKTLLPRGNTTTQILVRLVGFAGVRMVCGAIMIMMIHIYIFF
ncbi:DUF456 family protein [Sporomusa aerivorans]|uniref:DUF456 family protein n=1 Tax=Sporomusa aerivorans TaxID=204936 RepID=UPI003529EFCE